MSHQADTLSKHIRHALPNKVQWDALRAEYRRVNGGPATTIGMLADMTAWCLTEWAKLPDAEGSRQRGDEVRTSLAGKRPGGGAGSCSSASDSERHA